MRLQPPFFVTPSALPDGRECRSLSIPASQEWQGAVSAALLMMTHPLSWEQVNDTDMTPDEASAAAWDMFRDYLGSGQIGACGMKRASFLTGAAAGVSLGNSVANTAYQLAWTTAYSGNDAPLTQNADTIRFLLEPGEWSVRVQSSIANSWAEARLIASASGTVLMTGPLTFSGLAVLDWTWKIAQDTLYRVDVWHANGVVNGRGFASGYGAAILQRIDFVWRPLP